MEEWTLIACDWRVHDNPAYFDICNNVYFLCSCCVQQGVQLLNQPQLSLFEIMLVLLNNSYSECAKGLIGNTGIRGTPGFDGIDGKRGLRGDGGDTGVKGDQGLMGLPGIVGLKGERGPAGPKGNTGIPGKLINIITLIFYIIYFTKSSKDTNYLLQVARDLRVIKGLPHYQSDVYSGSQAKLTIYYIASNFQFSFFSFCLVSDKVNQKASCCWCSKNSMLGF
uniref:Uncharacterized protein n=1 Tax=Periophthalmus magnuspinnatus TaxID=409849 RepID=A0A3B4ABF6_9GOBI